MDTIHRLRWPAAAALAVGLLAAPLPLTQARVAEDSLASPPPARNGPIVFASSYIAVDPDTGSPSEVFRVRPDGSGLTQLTDVPDGFQAGAPDISPDGRRIVYVSNVSGNFGIWTMAVDGSSQRPLLETPSVDYLQPRWSPDGSRLAVVGCNVTPNFLLDCDILVLRADGTGMRKIVGGHWYNRAPVWSPDGRKIAFDSDREGFLSAVWVVSAAGGTPTRLTDPDLEAFWPSWSPDGSRILFSSNYARAHSDVYSMRPDGSGVRRLTHLPEDVGGAWQASYSPDGRQIVLISDIEQPTPFDFYDIFTMRADGSGLTRVVSTQPGYTPDWGPEGGAR
jgi:TolB protein